MTPQQIALLRRSADDLLGPRRKEVVAAFYRRLFAAEVELRAMFPADMGELEDKFGNELRFITESVRDFPRFAERVRALGATHGGHGVRARHYLLARQALFDTFAEFLGPAWTPQLHQAWHSAYDIVTELMMLSTAQTEAQPPSIRSRLG